ncbi:MAG: hypothetical protein LBE56_05735 [Tannerella sp.]|nr:hypothetical protein [Tannerella sp.]
MATLTLKYNAHNSVAQRIVNMILAMDDLFTVQDVTVEQNTATTQKEKEIAASVFLDKWAGKFTLSERETDDERYNYLVEKYK